MESVKDIILQAKNEEYIKKVFGTEQWVQISGHKNLNGADAGFWCGLVRTDQIEELFQDVGWDISAHQQSTPGFEGDSDGYHYNSSLLKEGFESVILYREFYGVKPDYIELSQEFVLLNNLRYDSISKSYWAMYDSGESEEAVKYTDATTILIKMKFLQSYSAAKQMAIVLFFDIRTQFDGKLSNYGLEEFQTVHFKSNDLLYEKWGGNMNLPQYAYSVLMGKKIIMPAPVEECGYWPFEKEKKYEDFIIGVDKFGREQFFSCDPDKLSNYFGANPDAPFYLTPIFFKKEVLQKYLSKPEVYEVRDGYLCCQSLWGVEIDNHYKDCISVYLGDLGRDLPGSEQSYWKSFNIVGDGKMSETAFQRDFLNMPVQSKMEDHIFQNLYTSVTKKWQEKYGWTLFLPLSSEDHYNISQIRIPITDSQPEFDQLVLSLVKVLIDSLNEKELRCSDNAADNQKGISKLENWFNINGIVDYEEHIQFLRDLQELRSCGTGHRKGKSYDKISKVFYLREKSKIDVFEDILKSANAFLAFLDNSVLQ